MTVEEVLFKINGDNSNLNRAVDGSERKLNSFASQINKVSGVIKSALAAFGGKKLFDFTVGSNADLEQYKTSFEVVLKSADEAQKKLEYLYKFGADTPFENEPLIEASILLENANLQTEKYLRTVGDTTAAFQKFGATIPEVAKPLTKLASGQTGEALERLRDFGITTRDLIEKGIQFDKNGSVISSVKETMDAVIATMDEKYGGMMEKQSKTFNGLMSTISDNLTAFGRKVGEEIFEKVKTEQSEFMGAWDRWSKDGTMDKAAKSISNFLLKIVEGITKGVEIIGKYNKEIIAIIGAVTALSTALKIASTAQAAFNVVAGANPYVAVAAGITALVGGLVAYNFAVQESNRQTVDMLKVTKQHLDETDDLIAKYEELRSKTQQTEQEKQELHTIEKRLAELYPQAANGIDTENQKYTTQIELVKSLKKEKLAMYQQDINLTASQAKIEVSNLVAQRDKLETDLKKVKAEKEKAQANFTGNEDLYFKMVDLRNQGKNTDTDNPEWKALMKEVQQAGYSNMAGFEFDMVDRLKDWEKLAQKELELTNKLEENRNKRFQYGEIIVEADKLKNPQNYQNEPGEPSLQSSQVPPAKVDSELDDNPRGSTTAAEKYTNEALESHIRYIEHKKRLNEMSIEAEINEYQYALNAFVQTEEERMDVTEKLFDARQRLSYQEKQQMDQRFQESLNWINQQKELGQLSAQEEIDAWTRVYTNQRNNIEAVAEATVNLYRLRKELLEQEINARTEDSYAWIENEKLRGKLSESQEAAAYDRMIQYHKEFMDKIIADEQIGAEDKRKILEQENKTVRELEEKKYSIQQEFIKKAVETYIDAKKNQLTTEEELENKRLNDKLKALEKEYDAIDSQERESKRAQDRAELLQQESFYAAAATKEGQEKLKKIREELQKLDEEEAKENREKEKQSRKESIQQELDDNKEKYKKLREDLETEQKQMLSAAAQFVDNANTVITDADQKLNTALGKAMETFERQQEDKMNTSLSQLKEFITEYSSRLSSLNTMIQSQSPSTSAAAMSIALAGTAGGNVSVTMNDYGDKNLYGVEDIQDYGRETLSATKDAVRASGGKFL